MLDKSVKILSRSKTNNLLQNIDIYLGIIKHETKNESDMVFECLKILLKPNYKDAQMDSINNGFISYRIRPTGNMKEKARDFIIGIDFDKVISVRCSPGFTTKFSEIITLDEFLKYLSSKKALYQDCNKRLTEEIHRLEKKYLSMI